MRDEANLRWWNGEATPAEIRAQAEVLNSAVVKAAIKDKRRILAEAKEHQP